MRKSHCPSPDCGWARCGRSPFAKHKSSSDPLTASELTTPYTGGDPVRTALTRLVRTHYVTLCNQGWGNNIENFSTQLDWSELALILDPCRPDMAPWTGKFP
jgi:hypothetical protein